MASSSSIAWLAPLLLSASAAAQSFNVDVASFSTPPTPSNGYGAAAGQPGHWNPIDVTVVNPPLLGLDGVATSVTLTRQDLFTIDYGFDSSLTQGDDGALMDDGESIGATPAMWTFSHLAAGDYALYTYAWASDSFTYRTRVSCGTQDPAQDVGGMWPGHQQLGVTYAVHHVGVSQGGSFTVSLVESPSFPVAGSLNGFQLVKLDSAAQTVCAGDGTSTACPCGNVGAAGHGCGNGVQAAGAVLSTSGSAWTSGDTLVLNGSGMPDGPVVYLQGSTSLGAGLGVVFGDGLRCAGGVLVRLGIKANGAGASHYPTAGELAVSIRGGVVAGTRYTYQAWYRDSASFCTTSTFNLTNGVEVVWNN